MPHDYRFAYQRGIKILNKVRWGCDPEAMFRPPSLAKGQPARLECERQATQRCVPVLNVCEDVTLAARIHHFAAVGGTEARKYFLSGRCPLDPKKLGQLSRRMPPFIQAKLPALLADSVNVVSNPTHAFDTDGWAELKRRLPKFRATMEYFAAHCRGTPMELGLEGVAIERLSAKLQSIQRECDLTEQKLRCMHQKEKGTPIQLQTYKLKPAPDWLKAYGRISQVHGVLQKTNRDLNSKFWKPEWMPTEAQLSGVDADVRAMVQAATTILAWLHQ